MFILSHYTLALLHIDISYRRRVVIDELVHWHPADLQLAADE